MALNTTPTPHAPETPSITSFLIKGGSVALVARLVAVATGFGTQMMLARLLDPVQLGAYFLTQSVVVATADVAQIGLPRVIVRELARSTGVQERGHVAAFARRALAIGIGSILVVAAAYSLFLGDFLASGVFGSITMLGTSNVAAVWIIGLAVQNIVSESLRGTHAVGWASVLGGSLASMLTCGVLFIVFMGDRRLDLSAVLTIAAFGTLVSGAFAAIILRRRIASLERAAPPEVGGILKSAVAMLALGMSTTVLAQSDLWILGIVLPEEEVALYGAARRLILLVSLPLMIVSLVVPPLISDLYAKNEIERLQRMLRGTASVAGLPSLLLLGVFVVWSEPILTIAFGEYYRPAARVLMILSFERMLFVLVGSCGMLLMMTGRDHLMLRVILVAGAIQVVSVYFGSKWGGIEGAAVGFFLASFVRTLSLWAVAWRSTGIRTDVSPVLAKEGLSLLSSSLRKGIGRLN